MKNTTKNLTTFPQTEAIPQPLEIHPSVDTRAAELLMTVAEIISKEPARYNQQKPIAYDCGSPCCIMGHVTLLSTGLHDQATTPRNTFLTQKQFDSFFFRDRWAIHSNGLAIDATPAQGIARIEHFLRTGE